MKSPYRIEVVNHASSITPPDISNQIFAATNGGDPNTFLLWLTTPGIDITDDLGRVTLLHTVSQFACHDWEGGLAMG